MKKVCSSSCWIGHAAGTSKVFLHLWHYDEILTENQGTCNCMDGKFWPVHEMNTYSEQAIGQSHYQLWCPPSKYSQTLLTTFRNLCDKKHDTNFTRISHIQHTTTNVLSGHVKLFISIESIKYWLERQILKLLVAHPLVNFVTCPRAGIRHGSVLLAMLGPGIQPIKHHWLSIQVWGV